MYRVTFKTSVNEAFINEVVTTLGDFVGELSLDIIDTSYGKSTVVINFELLGHYGLNRPIEVVIAAIVRFSTLDISKNSPVLPDIDSYCVRLLTDLMDARVQTAIFAPKKKTITASYQTWDGSLESAQSIRDWVDSLDCDRRFGFTIRDDGITAWLTGSSCRPEVILYKGDRVVYLEKHGILMFERGSSDE